MRSPTEILFLNLGHEKRPQSFGFPNDLKSCFINWVYIKYWFLNIDFQNAKRNALQINFDPLRPDPMTRLDVRWIISDLSIDVLAESSTHSSLFSEKSHENIQANLLPVWNLSNGRGDAFLDGISMILTQRVCRIARNQSFPFEATNSLCFWAKFHFQTAKRDAVADSLSSSWLVLTDFKQRLSLTRKSFSNNEWTIGKMSNTEGSVHHWAA